MPSNRHLTVFRFRHNDRKDQDFFDPGADIRRVLPTVYRAVLTTMNSVLLEEDTADAVALVKDIGVLARIRLIEEPIPIDRVLHLFQKELAKISPRVRDTFTQLFFMYSMAAYAVLLRREASNDRDIAKELFDTVEGMGLLYMLPDDLAAKVLRAIHVTLPTLHKNLTAQETKDKVSASILKDQNIKVVCEDMKKLADSLLPASGPMTWDEKAKALDTIVKESEDMDDTTKEVLKQAYVTYINKDVPEWKEAVIREFVKN